MTRKQLIGLIADALLYVGRKWKAIVLIIVLTFVFYAVFPVLPMLIDWVATQVE